MTMRVAPRVQVHAGPSVAQVQTKLMAAAKKVDTGGESSDEMKFFTVPGYGHKAITLAGLKPMLKFKATDTSDGVLKKPLRLSSEPFGKYITDIIKNRDGDEKASWVNLKQTLTQNLSDLHVVYGDWEKDKGAYDALIVGRTKGGDVVGLRYYYIG